MTQPGHTTIQVSRAAADLLRQRFPGVSYNDALISTLEVSSVPGGGTTIKHTHLIPFSLSVGSLEEGAQDQLAGVTGHILSAKFHFPSGANALVDARVLLVSPVGGAAPIIPDRAQSFIALDDFTLDLDGLWLPVNGLDVLRVEWVNHDAANPHRVPVELIIGETA